MTWQNLLKQLDETRYKQLLHLLRTLVWFLIALIFSILLLYLMALFL